MEITLRSSREFKEQEEMVEIEKHAKIGEEIKLFSSEVTEEERTIKVQQEQLVEEGVLRKKEEVQTYKPQVSFP